MGFAYQKINLLHLKDGHAQSQKSPMMHGSQENIIPVPSTTFCFLQSCFFSQSWNKAFDISGCALIFCSWLLLFPSPSPSSVFRDDPGGTGSCCLSALRSCTWELGVSILLPSPSPQQGKPVQTMGLCWDKWEDSGRCFFWRRTKVQVLFQITVLCRPWQDFMVYYVLRSWLIPCR